jgi:AraC-like DNA-binding protein
MNTPQSGITIVSVAFVVAISVGFFLSLMLFFSRKGNMKANRYLSLLILFFSLLQIWDVLVQTRLLIEFPHMIMVLNPLLFVLGPFVYFYVKALTSIEWKFEGKIVVHLIPAAVIYVFSVPVYLLGEQEKIRMISDAFLNRKFIIHPFFFVFGEIHILAYLFFSVRNLLEHSKSIKNNFSFTERLSLTWLRNLLIIFIILWLTFAIRVFYHSKLIWDISAFLALLTMYIVGYFGYNQPVIFQGSMSETLPAFDKEEKKKYASSSLTDEEINDYLKKLRTLMDNEKIFQQNDLKLGDVAEKMNLPAYYVSQVINEKLGKSFYDFINEYRVEEVKRRFADKKYDHMTILAAGFDSGFNSKTAFYSAFKKNTGATPTEFKKIL